MSRLILVWLVFLSASALAQAPPCSPPLLETCGERDPNGNLSITAGPIYDHEVRTHFLSSRGAYANALLHNTAASNFNTCSVSPPGTTPPGSSLADRCVLNTRECDAALFPSSGCGPDPYAQAGEISCWCRAHESHPIDALAAGSSKTFESTLLVDTDRDGNWDEARSSDVTKNPSSRAYLRLYRLFASLYRYEWEDVGFLPHGDFNDYVAATEVRPCNGHMPYEANLYEGSSHHCGDSLGGEPASCRPEGCEPDLVTMPNMRFTMAVGVDQLNSETGIEEGTREETGRKIVVTVAGYNLGGPVEVAVCPVLRFERRNIFRGYETTFVRYSGAADPKGCSTTFDGSGQPICNRTELQPHTYAVRFAREQLLDRNSCNEHRKGPGDKVTLTAANECGAGVLIQTYEINMKDIDSQLEALDHLSSIPAQRILGRIFGLDLLVFQDIKTAEFHCPSGVNVEYDGADPGIATGTAIWFNPDWRHAHKYIRH